MICDMVHDSMLTSVHTVSWYGNLRHGTTVHGMLILIHTIARYDETCLVIKIVNVTFTYSLELCSKT